MNSQTEMCSDHSEATRTLHTHMFQEHTYITDHLKSLLQTVKKHSERLAVVRRAKWQAISEDIQCTGVADCFDDTQSTATSIRSHMSTNSRLSMQSATR